MLRLPRKHENVDKKIMKLIKEMSTLSDFHFELESLTNDLKTLRFQTSALTSKKSIEYSLSVHGQKKNKCCSTCQL